MGVAAIGTLVWCAFAIATAWSLAVKTGDDAAGVAAAVGCLFPLVVIVPFVLNPERAAKSWARRHATVLRYMSGSYRVDDHDGH